MTSLPRWKCHKIAEAAPILKIRAATVFDAHGSAFHIWEVTVVMPGPKEEAPTAVIEVPIDTFSRGNPQPGDYLVKHIDRPDGTTLWSWSPKAVLEANYTPET